MTERKSYSEENCESWPTEKRNVRRCM